MASSANTSKPSTSVGKKPKDENNGLRSVDAVYSEFVGRAVGTVCLDAGFEAIASSAHRVLTHMTCTFLNDMCETAKRFCEHAGRTSVTFHDIRLSLDHMGVVFDEFCKMLDHIRRNPNSILSEPIQQSLPVLPPLLRVSEPHPHPPHMPAFLPPFPDPHTYIRTEISGEVDSDYEKVRRITAMNKRNTENSLVSLALATRPSVSLFQEYECHLATEAKEMLERAHQIKIRKLEARMSARNAQRLSQELANASQDANMLMNDLLQEDTADDSTIVVDDIVEDKNILKELEAEELFEIKDTEYSYIRRKIPDYCRLLLPFAEERPYISSLVTDDNLDDDANHYAKILSKEIEDELADASEDVDGYGGGQTNNNGTD